MWLCMTSGLQPPGNLQLLMQCIYMYLLHQLHVHSQGTLPVATCRIARQLRMTSGQCNRLNCTHSACDQGSALLLFQGRPAQCSSKVACHLLQQQGVLGQMQQHQTCSTSTGCGSSLVSPCAGQTSIRLAARSRDARCKAGCKTEHCHFLLWTLAASATPQQVY